MNSDTAVVAVRLHCFAQYKLKMLHILALIPWYLSPGYTVELYLDNLNTFNFITKCSSSTVDLSAIAGNMVQVAVGWDCISKEAGHLIVLASRMTFRLERRRWRRLNIGGDYAMKPRRWKKHNGSTSLL